MWIPCLPAEKNLNYNFSLSPPSLQYDCLNKTLPPNFKFRQKSQQSLMLHPTTQIRTSPMHATTPEGAESPTNRSGTGLRRSKPVDSSQKPNWSRYRDRQLGKSDPSLSPEVRKSTCTYMCYTCAYTYIYTVYCVWSVEPSLHSLFLVLYNLR